MKIRVRNTDLIPLAMALANLLPWLPPGRFHRKVARLKKLASLEAEELHEEQLALLEAYGVWDGEGQDRRPVLVNYRGQQEQKVHHKAEFDTKEDALMKDVTILEVPHLLTDAELDELETHSKGPSLDMSFLDPVVESTADVVRD
jgi:hypothetical protein